MKPILRAAAATLAVTLSSGALAPPAQAYPVDCAILLCLAGGWPTSVPCTHARIEFIRRITPFPIEPPLQIWRCPLTASQHDPSSSAMRIIEAADLGTDTGLGSSLLLPLPGNPSPANGTGGADLSDPAFAFIRSIRVFHVQYGQHENNDDRCRRYDLTEVGTYDATGAFGWSQSSIRDLPPVVEFDLPDNCDDHRYRSVFVDWQDQVGGYGFEEVRY